MPSPRLMIIASRELAPDLPAALQAALAAVPRGGVIVQVREKALPAGPLLLLVRTLLPVCRAAGALCVVNDRLDVALAAGLDGVHLPAQALSVPDARALLGAGAFVGRSCHSAAEVSTAAREGADLCLFAPVFAVPGKGPAAGLDALSAAARASALPVFALGGIDATNAAAALAAGARGVACLRGILGAPDPAAAARALWASLASALVLAIALLFTPPARADDSRYQDYPVGSRAMALGGAFVALGDDPAGLTYNPAGICDTRMLNVSVSASLYGIERQTRKDLTLIGQGTFSLSTLATLNVIPGEAGILKGFGAQDARGSQWAIGFDVTVPSFRTYGLEQREPNRAHTRVIDRTFDVAAGAGWRFNEWINLGASLHSVVRLYDQAEDALTTEGTVDPKVGSYTATGRFQGANLVGELGAKLRFDDGRWLVGAALGLPGISIYSAGAVSIQDVVADPRAPDGQKITIHVLDTEAVVNETPAPFFLRAGAALIERAQYTLTVQLTFHAGATYHRFGLAPDLADRLRIQDTVERRPVLDFNLGGEYLLNREWSVAGGVFSSNSGAQRLQTLPDGTLAPGSSRLANVSLIGGTATLGMLGNHSISRLGVSVSYGSGEDALPNDPTGVFDRTGYTRAEVKQLFLYVFLASTFRY